MWGSEIVGFLCPLAMVKPTSVMAARLIIKNRRQLRRQICLSLLGVIMEEFETNERRHWVRPFLRKRQEAGDFYVAIPDMIKDDPEYFFQIFRFTPEAFEDLLALVGPLLARNDVVREPVCEKQRLLLTLEYLATGDMQKSIAKDYRLGRSTVCGIIRDTCLAIIKVLQPKVLPIPETGDWIEIAKEFHRIWNFPNCVGSIDGKHFAIPKPAGSGSVFYNHKKFFSLVLLASCDANYKFTTINIGAAGSESDGGIFRRSYLGQKLLSSTMNLPPPSRVPGTNLLLPHVFVADEAFPLLKNLMRPFPGERLSIQQRIYNYRLSRARRIIENAFGILVVRWRLLLKTISMNPENAELAIHACILLHNYIRSVQSMTNLYVPNGFVDFEDPITRVVRHGHWRDVGEGVDIRLSQQGSNNSTKAAIAIRNNFMEYFNTVGTVPWQIERIVDY